MKIQKPCRAIGVWNTPANKIIIESRIVTTRPDVVASGKGATTIFANVPARM
ncbi:hypothetical protein FOPG_19823 [Fusarium oxysporum f. sp. conglutinans race 2 54008]|uniref:Uncharacterized protein n=1 Tax=Fusarium oxysporum f. sp. conglutinans race 2 54008 TaxID=1089457 RepID=X0GVS0_FUSOX|nr:hypothetical protein FOPG_19823 [Fusarium oxysporum f. sp. conglutinans race 2 54008]